MSVTQSDIARRLGISRQLVGFALNGNPSVSETTRKKIQRAARRMGYDVYSNRDARSLIGKRYGLRAATGIIAVLMPPFMGTPLRDMPFFAPFLDGAEAEAARRGLDLLLCSSRNDGLPRLITQQGVDGVVCVSLDPVGVRRVRALKIPVVNLGRHAPSAHSLVADDRLGIRLAVNHLIGLGHRKFAYLGHNCEVQTAQERLTAFVETLQEHGLTASESNVEATVTQQTMEGGTEAFVRLLERNDSYKKSGRLDFTALVCYNDILAMGVARHAATCGIKIPQDLSITGFDDISTQYGLQPALTSVAFPREEMGRRAIELLCETPSRKPALRHETFAVSLVVRDSTRAAKPE
jgi:DNA-binding LacI/PurR family transcriptional regulator